MSGAQSAPPRVAGLVLAEHCFGPLLSPIVATPAQWITYTKHRRATDARYTNLFGHRKRLISDAVAAVEGDLGLDAGTLPIYDVEWDYSLGYKIHQKLSEPPTAYRNPSTKDSPPD